MSDSPNPSQPPAHDAAPERNATPGVTTKPQPVKPQPRLLPPWKVLLHNDDDNEISYVIETILLLTPLKHHDAVDRTLEAHQRGLTLLLTTHKERAELYAQQFGSRNLTVTIEPAEK